VLGTRRSEVSYEGNTYLFPTVEYPNTCNLFPKHLRLVRVKAELKKFQKHIFVFFSDHKDIVSSRSRDACKVNGHKGNRARDSTDVSEIKKYMSLPG
jgi:hypothetical protein